MDKKLLGTIALTTIVVAVVVSVLTASITGNYIWVSKVDRLVGTNRVYTVNEMDAKITGIYTEMGKRLTIDSLDRKCGLVLSSGQNSCHQTCLNKGNFSCMVGQVFVGYKTNASATNSLNSIIGCTDDPINEFVKDPDVDIDPNQLTDIDMSCICCEL